MSEKEGGADGYEGEESVQFFLALERERSSENEVYKLLFTYVPPAQMYQNALYTP